MHQAKSILESVNSSISLRIPSLISSSIASLIASMISPVPTANKEASLTRFCTFSNPFLPHLPPLFFDAAQAQPYCLGATPCSTSVIEGSTRAGGPLHWPLKLTNDPRFCLNVMPPLRRSPPPSGALGENLALCRSLRSRPHQKGPTGLSTRLNSGKPLMASPLSGERLLSLCCIKLFSSLFHRKIILERVENP
jgi:hypothetical protein